MNKLLKSHNANVITICLGNIHTDKKIPKCLNIQLAPKHKRATKYMSEYEETLSTRKTVVQLFKFTHKIIKYLNIRFSLKGSSELSLYKNPM